MSARQWLLVFVGLLAFGSYAQASTAVEEYFPLVEGSEYTYHAAFKDKQYTEQVVVRSSQLQRGPKVFYFTDKTDDPTKGSIGIGSRSFGLGCYFFREGNLYTLDAYFLREVPALDPSRAQLLLGRDWALGSAHDITGIFPGKVVVEGYEDVRVPAGQFRSWGNHDSFLGGAVSQVSETLVQRSMLAWVARSRDAAISAAMVRISRSLRARMSAILASTALGETLGVGVGVMGAGCRGGAGGAEPRGVDFSQAAYLLAINELGVFTT